MRASCLAQKPLNTLASLMPTLTTSAGSLRELVFRTELNDGRCVYTTPCSASASMIKERGIP